MNHSNVNRATAGIVAGVTRTIVFALAMRRE